MLTRLENTDHNTLHLNSICETNKIGGMHLGRSRRGREAIPIREKSKILPWTHYFIVATNRQILVGFVSQLDSWSEINTYIHLVSRREQRCSCPCSLIRSRNSSSLSDKLWCNRNIIQNSWIQCLVVRKNPYKKSEAEDKCHLLDLSLSPYKVTYLLTLGWLLIIHCCFKCN